MRSDVQQVAPPFLVSAFVFLVMVAFAGSGIALAASAKGAVNPPTVFSTPPVVGAQATCPVMGHAFTVKKDSPRSQTKGKHVVFCCAGCKPKFDADPEKYLNGK